LRDMVGRPIKAVSVSKTSWISYFICWRGNSPPFLSLRSWINNFLRKYCQRRATFV
jgi:hypothetical protein